MGLSVPGAELGGTLWETLAYGVYISLLPRGLRVLLRHEYKSRILKYFIVTLCISFISITLHLVADIARVAVAFTSHPDDARFPSEFYSVVNDRLNVLKSAGYIITTIVMDLLIVFRTFIVWNKDWRIILFPAVLCGADIVKSIWIVWSTSLFAHPPSKGFFAPSLQLLAFFALTLGLNFVCTSLIVVKIASAHHLLSRFSVAASRSRLTHALALILESAFLYTLLLFIALILAIKRDNGLNMIFNMLPPMIGIIFLHVILRSADNNSGPRPTQNTMIRSNRTTNSQPARFEVELDTPQTEFRASSYSKNSDGVFGQSRRISSEDSEPSGSEHYELANKAQLVGNDTV